MKTAAFLTVSTLMGAQAFMAPAPKFSRTRGVARMSFEDEAGVTAPLGYWVSPFPSRCSYSPRTRTKKDLPSSHKAHPLPPSPPFPPPQDPLGLSADGDVEKFNKYRAAEIKHGRGTSRREREGMGKGT
jgi:hypothetical protein